MTVFGRFAEAPATRRVARPIRLGVGESPESAEAFDVRGPLSRS